MSTYSKAIGMVASEASVNYNGNTSDNVLFTIGVNEKADFVPESIRFVSGSIVALAIAKYNPQTGLWDRTQELGNVTAGIGGVTLSAAPNNFSNIANISSRFAEGVIKLYPHERILVDNNAGNVNLNYQLIRYAST